MTKTLYRVGEGANLVAFPRGTKVGSVIPLTEAEAMYERDLGRITVVDAPVPGETLSYPVDAVSGEPLKLTDQERTALPALDRDASDEAVLDQGFPRSRKAR